MESETFDDNIQEDNLTNMIRYVLGEIGNIEADPSDITEMEEIETILRSYYQMFDSLEPLKELMPNDFGFHEYLNNLTSKFSREVSDYLRNNEKLEETQKNLNFKSGVVNQNKQNKKDDLKITKTSKVYEGRFEEKKLDFFTERNALDFDNLVEQVYPKEYIPGPHDNDIREILKHHRLDNYPYDGKQISHDNYKLLLVLMKNKKAALYENNFYNLEYSTEWDKIICDNNYKSKDSITDKNHYPDNYVEMFKNMLRKK